MKIKLWGIASIGLCITIATPSFAEGTRQLLVKITWTSGQARTDFDMLVKSPDGKICNYGGEGGAQNQSDWGCVHLKDDQGTSNERSYEAFAFDLDKMDRYATKNNLLGRGDASDYQVYISRYTGPDIKVRFSYGYTGECKVDNSFDCPSGKYSNGTPWEWNVSNTKTKNALYAVRYTPQYNSEEIKSDDALLSEFAPIMAFHENDYLPSGIDVFLNHAVLYEDTFGNNTAKKYGASLPRYIAPVGFFEIGEYFDISSNRMSLEKLPDISNNSNIFFLDLINYSRYENSGIDEKSYSFYTNNTHTEVFYRPYDLMKNNEKIVYGRVLNQNGKKYLQYHFFYLINQWNGNGGRIIGYHEGDWEGMIIELDEHQKPLRATTSAHIPAFLYKGGETKPWANVEKIDNHPVVYVGKGGHPTYFSNGITDVAFGLTGTDDHSGTGIILQNSVINTNSINPFATNIKYRIVNIETNDNVRKWLTSPFVWGQDFSRGNPNGLIEKSVQAPLFFDPDRWNNSEKWMDDRE